MSHQSHNRKIFLASSSPYRKLLLQRLLPGFSVEAPRIDESRLPDETPGDLVGRLAEQKAGVVSRAHPDAIVIGSDQVAVCEGGIVGKPGTRDRAVAQLRQFSGKSVVFLTAVNVCCAATGFSRSETVASEARFRMLADEEIERYVDLDNPLDCAGSFKSESAGSALLDYLRSDDPTAIIGLPLVTVAALLRDNGLQIP